MNRQSDTRTGSFVAHGEMVLFQQDCILGKIMKHIANFPVWLWLVTWKEEGVWGARETSDGYNQARESNGSQISRQNPLTAQLSSALLSHTYSPYCLKVRVGYHDADPFNANFPQFRCRSVFSVCILCMYVWKPCYLWACLCLLMVFFVYIYFNIYHIKMWKLQSEQGLCKVDHWRAPGKPPLT